MKQKYLKKKETPQRKWVLIGTVLTLALAAVFALVFGNSGQKQAVPSPSETSETTPSQAQETAAEEPTSKARDAVTLMEFKDGRIELPDLTLYYPESFEDCLLVANISREPYILAFYAVLPEKAEQRIFDVCVGAGSDGNLGLVATDKGDIPVSMTLYSFDPDDTWDEGEIDTILAMQEATNELINRLDISDERTENRAPAVKEVPEETAVVNFMQIETPYCILQYPASWEDRLSVEHFESEDVYRVAFYCHLEGHEQLLMFTVLLGGDEGEQMGVVTNAKGITVPVNLLMNTPSEDGLQDDELEILHTMQEAVNVLIQQLPLQ